MAYTANKPIVPMYFSVPKKWYSRRIAVVGEPIDVREICGKRPSTDDFDRVCELLHEKEKELQAFYYEKYPQKIKKSKKESD